MTTWEQLEKNQNDDSTIEEAVAVLIQDHDDDVNAHTDAGQALTGHRAAEIIDHLAESVVNDKLKRNSRRYIAIVDPNSESDFETLAAAVEYAEPLGGGDIFINRGTHYISANMSISPLISLFGRGVGESVLLSNDANQKIITIDNYANSIQKWLEISKDSTTPTTVTITSDLNPTITLYEGQALWINEGDDTGEYHITDIIDDTHFTITPEITVTEAITDCYVTTGITVINATKEVILPGTQTCTNQKIWLGTTIEVGWGGETAVVDEIIDDNTFTVKENIGAATGYFMGAHWVAGTTGLTIADITFGNSTTGVGILGRYLPEKSALDRSEFLGPGIKIDASVANNGLLTIDNCYFECYSADWAVQLAGGIVQNSTFYGMENGAKMLENYGCRLVIGCAFSSATKTGTLALRDMAIKNTYIGCDFYHGAANMLGTGKADGTGQQGTFIDCYVWPDTNTALSITSDNCNFINGEIYHSAGYPANITSAANLTRIIGTKMTEPVTDAGTNTVLFCDVLQQYIAAGSGDTAMAFKTRKVVELTPNSSRTLTTTVPRAGQERHLRIKTSGTSSYTMTFGAGFKTTGTLATGTTTNRQFIVYFISDGTNLIESGRTAAFAV
jgi:hypothetical protein